MAFPVLTNQDLLSLQHIFQKTSEELSSAAGYYKRNVFEKWANGKGEPTVNEYFAIITHCGLTPSESIDWLTAANKVDQLKVLHQIARNRKPVVLLDEIHP